MPPLKVIRRPMPKRYKICKKHANALCAYDPVEYVGCPFCTAQNLINPMLKETSLLKLSMKGTDDVEEITSHEDCC